MPSRKILIVDTEAVTADISRITLENLGYQVYCVATGEQAVEIAEKTRFDLAFVNGMLPGMNGIDTFEMLRMHDPGIIGLLLCDHAVLPMIVEAMNRGFSGLLEKPLDPRKLEKSIGDVFLQRQIQEENTRLHTLLPLYHLGQRFLIAPTIEDILEELVAIVCREIHVPFASVMMPSEEDGCLKIKASRGIDKKLVNSISLKPGEKIAGWVFAKGQPLILNRDTQEATPFSSLLKRKEIAAAISFPLKGREKTIGVLNISQTKPEVEYSQSDLELLTIICGQAVMAIENLMFIHEREENARSKALLEQYVSPEVANLLIASNENLMQVGDIRQLTVLFADIRHFTLLVQHLSLDDLHAFLNNFFECFTREIFTLRGTLDKFMGDAALVIFGAPLVLERPSVAAVTAAMRILADFEKLREEWAKKSVLFKEIGLGIGISRGEMFLGNVGSARRLDYTVIGADVNIAQRLASETGPGQILITESVREDIGDIFPVREEPTSLLRGLEKEIPIFSIISSQ